MSETMRMNNFASIMYGRDVQSLDGFVRCLFSKCWSSPNVQQSGILLHLASCLLAKE
jgi:hypothetical protein